MAEVRRTVVDGLECMARKWRVAFHYSMAVERSHLAIGLESQNYMPANCTGMALKSDSRHHSLGPWPRFAPDAL